MSDDPSQLDFAAVIRWHEIGCIFGWGKENLGSRLIHCDACSPLGHRGLYFNSFSNNLHRQQIVMNHSSSHNMPGSLHDTIPTGRQNASNMKSAGLGGKPHTLAAEAPYRLACRPIQYWVEVASQRTLGWLHPCKQPSRRITRGARADDGWGARAPRCVQDDARARSNGADVQGWRTFFRVLAATCGPLSWIGGLMQRFFLRIHAAAPSHLRLLMSDCGRPSETRARRRSREGVAGREGRYIASPGTLRLPWRPVEKSSCSI